MGTIIGYEHQSVRSEVHILLVQHPVSGDSQAIKPEKKEEEPGTTNNIFHAIHFLQYNLRRAFTHS